MTKYTKTVNGTLYHICEGLCDDIPTKWVTLSEWDGIISIQMVDGELKYSDGNGKEMLVFESDETGWLIY